MEKREKILAIRSAQEKKAGEKKPEKEGQREERGCRGGRGPLPREPGQRADHSGAAAPGRDLSPEPLWFQGQHPTEALPLRQGSTVTS